MSKRDEGLFYTKILVALHKGDYALESTLATQLYALNPNHEHFTDKDTNDEYAHFG